MERGAAARGTVPPERMVAGWARPLRMGIFQTLDGDETGQGGAGTNKKGAGTMCRRLGGKLEAFVQGPAQLTPERSTRGAEALAAPEARFRVSTYLRGERSGGAASQSVKWPGTFYPRTCDENVLKGGSPATTSGRVREIHVPKNLTF